MDYCFLHSARKGLHFHLKWMLIDGGDQLNERNIRNRNERTCFHRNIWPKYPIFSAKFMIVFRVYRFHSLDRFIYSPLFATWDESPEQYWVRRAPLSNGLPVIVAISVSRQKAKSIHFLSTASHDVALLFSGATWLISSHPKTGPTTSAPVVGPHHQQLVIVPPSQPPLSSPLRDLNLVAKAVYGCLATYSSYRQGGRRCWLAATHQNKRPRYA